MLDLLIKNKEVTALGVGVLLFLAYKSSLELKKLNLEIQHLQNNPPPPVQNTVGRRIEHY